MFRVQNNVPSIYVEESRDFQTISRLIDIVVNSVRFDAKSLSNILNPFKVNDRMLELLCTRVGFFARYSYDLRLLRYIISAFPYIIKDKGSKKGIIEAISLILKVDGIADTPEIFIDNENYNITIYTGTKIYNKVALLDVLSYIIPIGYTYSIEEMTYKATDSTTIKTDDILNILYNPSSSNSQVRGSDREDGPFKLISTLEKDYVGTPITSEIIGSETDSISVTIDGEIEVEESTGRYIIDTSENGYIKFNNQQSGPTNFVNKKEEISN